MGGDQVAAGVRPYMSALVADSRGMLQALCACSTTVQAGDRL